MLLNLFKKINQVLFFTLSLGLSVAVWGESSVHYEAAQPTANAVTDAASTPMLTPKLPPKTLMVFTPPPPQLEAAAYKVINAQTGNEIASQNAEARLAPASLTKLMTLYLVFAALHEGRIHMDDNVVVSAEAWKTGGSKMFIKVGDSVPVEQLLQGIVVDSGNDACVAIAEHLAGSQDVFVNLMNQQAKILGMQHTHFMDATGLPSPEHYTTANDLAILARAIIRDFPEQMHWFKQKSFEYNKIKQYNRNRLLWRDETVDGLKTGHTDDAGFCLIATAKRAGTRLIAVVLKVPSDRLRATNTLNLLNYAFRFYETKRLYAANQSLSQLRVYKGEHKTIPVGFSEDLFVTIPRGNEKALQTKLVLPENMAAPVTKGETVGNLEVMLNGKIILHKPLVALQDDPLGSWWTRILDVLKVRG